MGFLNFLFNKKSKSNLIETKLNGTGTEKRQEVIKQLTSNDVLKVDAILTRGTLGLGVFFKNAQIGTIDSKLVHNLEEKYSTSNGLSVDINVKTFKTIANGDKIDVKVLLEIIKP